MLYTLFLCVLPLLTHVEGGLITLAIKVHNKNQQRRVDRWSSTYPRAIPNYSVVSEGQYYFYGGGANMQAFGGDYYRAQDECDSRGDDCWGFQTTFGCTDRLGCSQALILEDPMDTKMHSIIGTHVYTKITQTWDAVPLQCTGLHQITDASTVGECEFSCTSDSECQIYQWLEDNTCWIGQSNDCTSTDGHVVEGYRIRPVAWTPVQKQCDGLKWDGTAKGNLEQCQYNCQWDQTCDSYQFFKDGDCWRGKSACDGVFNPKVDSDGKKDYKFIWKPLMGQCSGLNVDTSAARSADKCKSNCEADDDCSLWQYYEDGECYRGHAADCYTLHSRTVAKGGYRWYVTNQDKDEYEQRKTPPNNWQCHQYTSEETSRVNSGTSERSVCESVDGHVFTGGANTDYDGCGSCFCCKPAPKKWQCHHYTSEETSLVNSGTPERSVCESVDGHVFAGGANTDYDGCGSCFCCKPETEGSVRRLLQREQNLE